MLCALMYACNNDDDGETAVASIASVSDGQAAEGGTITHTVTVNNNSAGANFSATITNGSANDGDFDADLANTVLGNGVTFSATDGGFSVPAGVNSFTVAIVTVTDDEDEESETYTLTVGGQSGTGTITDTAPEVEPLFGVGGLAFTQQGPVGFLSLVTSLEEGQTDLEQALEIPGGAVIDSDGNGNIFVGRSDSPVVTRFTVDEENNLVEGPTVSFANAGLPGIVGFPDQFQFISETKAYFVDNTTLQLIVWNPSDMTFTAGIPITGLPAASTGGSTTLTAIVNSDDQVIIVARYNDVEGLAEGRSAIVFVDTQTDMISIDTTESCGGISGVVVAQNGDIYYASNNISAVENAFGFDVSFDPCWIRVPAGSNEIDDTFVFNPNSLTGSDLTAGMIQGPNNSVYVQAYDESIIPLDLSGFPRDVQGTPAWRVWNVPDVGNPMSAVLLESVPASAGGLFSFVVDGQTYIASIRQDFSGGVLVNITDINNITQGLDVSFIPASVFSVN